MIEHKYRSNEKLDLERIKKIAKSIGRNERKLQKVINTRRTDDKTKAVIAQFKKAIKSGFVAIHSIEKTIEIRKSAIDKFERNDEIVEEKYTEIVEVEYQTAAEKYGRENGLSTDQINALLANYLKNKETNKG